MALEACGTDNVYLARLALGGAAGADSPSGAPAGATIVVYTAAMRAHVEQAVRTAGRGDLIVRQQDAPPAPNWS
jgi:hypothetical protein